MISSQNNREQEREEEDFGVCKSETKRDSTTTAAAADAGTTIAMASIHLWHIHSTLMRWGPLDIQRAQLWPDVTRGHVNVKYNVQSSTIMNIAITENARGRNQHQQKTSITNLQGPAEFYRQQLKGGS